MGKVPIRLREVVYTLSPFEQTVMNGVFKDVPEKLHRKFSEVRHVDSVMLRPSSLAEGSHVRILFCRTGWTWECSSLRLLLPLLRES